MLHILFYVALHNERVSSDMIQASNSAAPSDQRLAFMAHGLVGDSDELELLSQIASGTWPPPPQPIDPRVSGADMANVAQPAAGSDPMTVLRDGEGEETSSDVDHSATPPPKRRRRHVPPELAGSAPGSSSREPASLIARSVPSEQAAVPVMAQDTFYVKVGRHYRPFRAVQVEPGTLLRCMAVVLHVGVCDVAAVSVPRYANRAAALERGERAIRHLAITRALMHSAMTGTGGQGGARDCSDVADRLRREPVSLRDLEYYSTALKVRGCARVCVCVTMPLPETSGHL